MSAAAPAPADDKSQVPTALGATVQRQGSTLSAAKQRSRAPSQACAAAAAPQQSTASLTRRPSGDTAPGTKVSGPQGEAAAASCAGSRKGSVASAVAAEAAAQLTATIRSTGGGAEAVAEAAQAEIDAATAADRASAANVSRRASMISQQDEAARTARQPSRSTLHAPPEPESDPMSVAIDPTDCAALQARIEELTARLESKDQELRKAEQQVENLEQTNASLNRLMQSQSQDAKVKLLNEDLQKRAATIKKLEEENKRLHKKAESSGSRPVSRQPSVVSGGDRRVLEEKDGQIRDLKAQLMQRDAELSRARESVDRPQSAARPVQSGDAGLQDQNVRLRQMLAEREAEKQQIQLRLERAQDAILSSAGAGFENEVKLQQARTALQCILRAHKSPPPVRNASPSYMSSSAYRSRTADVGAPVYSSYLGGSAPRLPPPPPIGAAAGATAPRMYSPPRDRFAHRLP
eukprot:TRINITY_DN1674_c11_g1_i1.p1 TRINITY_DN1674_c11_g1~~TRINITY_DN1674_c11_g1_i1.p1  ORF type:complete len:535 (+),score=124.21 TRINITY_DN1674_c11_g1_i1:215-1606(+)